MKKIFETILSLIKPLMVLMLGVTLGLLLDKAEPCPTEYKVEFIPCGGSNNCYGKVIPWVSQPNRSLPDGVVVVTDEYSDYVQVSTECAFHLKLCTTVECVEQVAHFFDCWR